MKSFAVRIAAAALAAAASFAVQAQSWPTQPIRIVVPFTPGTGMDTIARTISPRLSERLGQPVVVQNTPGASGNIGASNVAKSRADGYTILMGANTMLIATQLQPNAPFDPVKDFSPLTMAAYGTLMLVAHPKSGIKSMQDLVAQAKARPGRVTFGSPGVGTPHHMAMELFKSKTGLFMLHVPYKGTAGYVQDLLSGELMAGFLPVHVAQGFVNDGRLTALAVGSAKRHPVAPQVPSIEELGIKDANAEMWYAFFLPANAPAPVVNRLQSELEAILKLPEVRGVLGKAGMDATTSTPGELATVVQSDYQRWGAVIQRANIKAE